MAEEERKLYVGNLPVDIVEAEVQEVFGLYGSIEEVHINVPKDGRNVRSAFVRFEEPKDAAAAMAVLGDMYKFRDNSLAVRINLAHARPDYRGGKASGGKGYGETGYGSNGAATAPNGASAGTAPAAPLAGPPHVAAPPPPAAISSRAAGGHPMTPAPPPAPTSSYAAGGAAQNGGNSQWNDGYGRSQDKGRPDNSRNWGPGTYPGDAGGGGGKDPISGRDMSAKLWVGNLPGDVTPEVIEEVFKYYGLVEDVSILPNKSRSGQVCAFVHYATSEMADACLQAMASGYEFRPGEGELKVERPAGRKGGGYKGGYDDKGKGGKRGYQPY